MQTRRGVGAVGSAVLLTVTMSGAALTPGGSPWPAGDDPGRDAMGGAMSGAMSASTSSTHGGSMRVDSEVGYLTSMIPHHEEAVAAARELSRSERPEMRALGASIVTTQTAEIEQMRQWLARWYPGATPDTETRPLMRDLTGLSGDALDRAFLQDMVMHHAVAVMMSQQLLRHGLADHGDVRDFAAQVRDDQRAQIGLMTGWLRTWFGVGTGMMPRHPMRGMSG